MTLHVGRRFGVVRQGLALRRRSLYDRLSVSAACYVAEESRGHVGKPGPPRLTADLVPVQWFVPHTGVRERSGQPNQSSLPGSSSRNRAKIPRPERKVWAMPLLIRRSDNVVV